MRITKAENAVIRLKYQRYITAKKQKDAFEAVKKANEAKRAKLLAQARLANIKRNEAIRVTKKQTPRAMRLTSEAGYKAIRAAKESEKKAVQVAVIRERESKRLAREEKTEALRLQALQIAARKEQERASERLAVEAKREAMRIQAVKAKPSMVRNLSGAAKTLMTGLVAKIKPALMPAPTGELLRPKGQIRRWYGLTGVN